ncbi:MauE/DoxX family redox-associated membrane protein [Verrucomicrobiota bacterium sgz303538]
MAKQIVEWILRLTVAAVFIYAGILKAWDTQQFALDVQNYQLTSWTASVVVAVYLPWLEIFAGFAILARRLYSGALVALLGMTLVFLVAIGSAWARDLDISCGCFGKEVVKVSYPHLLARDAALLGAIGVLLWLDYRRLRRVPGSSSHIASLTTAEAVKD